MALNPFAEIFGDTAEEDEEEDALRLLDEEEVDDSDNPFASIFSGEIPEEEPEPLVPEEPEQAASPEPDLPAEESEGGVLAGLGEFTKAAKEFTISGLEETVANPFREGFARLVGADPEEVGISIGRTNITEDAERRRELGVEAQKKAAEMAPENDVGKFLYDLSGAAIQMAPSIGVSYLTRKPNLGLLTMGAQVYGDAFARARAEGKDLDGAKADALVAFATELGPEKAFNVFGGLAFGRGAKSIIKQMLSEAPSEGLTSILQIADEMGREGKDVQPLEAIGRVLYDTAMGAGLGFSTALPGAISQPFAERRAENKVLEAMVPNLPQDLSRDEALASLSPDRAQAYFEPVVEETVTELPPIDLNVAHRSLKAQEVGVSGNVTLDEAPLLERVKEKADAVEEAVGQSLEEVFPTSAALQEQVAVPESAPAESNVVTEEFGRARQPREDIDSTLAQLSDTISMQVPESPFDVEEGRAPLEGVSNPSTFTSEELEKSVKQAVRKGESANEPTAPEPRAEHKVETDYENGYYTLSTDQGTLSAVESSDGKTVSVDTANVEEAAQGQGRGTALYTKLFETAARKGQEVQSSNTITDAAYRTWRSLERAGHKVDFNPTRKMVRNSDGSIQHITTDGEPVATIRPKATTAAPVTVDVGKQKLYRGFHNTPVGEVQIGDLGAHFTPSESVAQSKTGDTGEVGTYEADIEKPLRVPREPDNGAWHDPSRVIAVLEESGVKIPDRIKIRARKASSGNFVVANPEKDSIQAKALADIREFLKSEGYDAVVYGNEYEGGGDSVILLDPQRAKAPAKEVPFAEDEGIEVEELTQEQLDAELAKAKKPARQKIDKTNLTKKKITKKKVVKEKKLTEKQRIKKMRAEAKAKEAAKGEKIVKNQRVKQPDVVEGLNRADEVRRLTGKPPGPPKGPMTVTERTDMRTMSRKEIEVNSVLSALASVADNANVDLGDTAQLRLEKTANGYILRSETGTDLTLTSQDVQNLRYAELGAWKGGIGNYLRLKLDTAGISWRGHKYSPNFRRTKTGKLTRDQATEVLRVINSARVGVHSKLEVLATQWEDAKGQQIQDAPKDQLEPLNAFLTGNLSMNELQQQVELTPEMVRSLTSLRKDIDILSRIMVAEGMIDNQLAFQIDKNMGTYLRVQYALKDIEARMDKPDSLLALIPEEKRARVGKALFDAYMEPAMLNELHKLPRGSLKRLAGLAGLISEKVVGARTRIDEDGNEIPVAESQVITGTNIDLDRAKASVIAAALQQKLMQKPLVAEDVMLRFLQGRVGGAQASMHGREKSAERARKLSRTEEQLRKDKYTEEEIVLNSAFRGMLAEHLDPVTTIQQTVNTMLNHIASHRVVASVVQMAPTGAVSVGKPNTKTGATEKLVPAGDKWADVRVVDPKTGESVSASDVYVRSEVKMQFDRLVRPNFADGLLTNVYRSAQAITKINLTALNAGSHFRNIRSSLEIAAMRGYVLNPNLARSMRALSAAAQIAEHDIGYKDQKWSDEALDSAAQYLTRLGILHDSVRTGSIKELLQRMNSSKDVREAFGEDTYLTASGATLESALGTAMHRMGKTKGVRQAKQKLADTPLGAYRMEDEGPKILAFLQEREIVADMMNRPDLLEVMKGKRRPTKAERKEIKAIDLKASKKIRNLFPTYSSVPEFVKDLSANLFATPFPSFNAEMIRNWAYDIRDIADMAAYTIHGKDKGYYGGMDKKKVAARLTGRLISWSAMGAYYGAMLSSIGFAMGWMMSLPFGATPDDEDEITKKARALTERMAEHGYVPGATELDAYDPFFRALLPGWGKSNLYRIVGFEPGKSITVMDMSYTMPYSQLTQLSVNLGGAVGAILEGDTEEAARATENGIMKFVGEWSAQEPLMDAVLELATGKSEFGDLEGWDRADSLIQMITPGSQTYKSLERLVAPADDPHQQDLSDFVLGQRPFTLYFDKSYVNALWPEKLAMRSASVKIRDMIRDAAEGKVSEDEFRDRYRDYEEDRIRAMSQIEFINHSSDIVGFNKSMRRKAVAESTLTGDNRIPKSSLIDGKWYPTYLVPGDIYKPNQRPDPKLTREYRRWINVMQETQREYDWR